MKYKRIIFISLLLSLIGLMCLFVFAEKKALPIITWDKTFGGRLDDGAESLIQTTDGGYAIAGRTNSKGAGHRDFWVIKLDHQGNMVWDRTYGGRDDDGAWSLIQTTDGGYAVAGYTSSKGAGDDDFWVIKLDHQGNMVWDRAYGRSGEDRAYSLIQTTDGGYAVAGWTKSKGAGDADFWVIKLDHQGNMVWDRTFGGSDSDEAWSLIQTTDGGYAVAGYTRSKGAGHRDFWVIKLDHQGNMVWDRTYGGRDLDVAESLIQTTDGGYAVAGYTRSKGAGDGDFWVIKLDKKGNKVWDRTYGGSDWDLANSLIQTTDGGYAVAGWAESKGAGGQDWQDFWIIKLASYSGVEEIPSSTLQEGKLWEDIRIGIIVNKVEQAVVLSPEITEELSLFLKEMPKPAKGNNLVYIQLTIVKIKDVHVISLGGRDDEKSFLTDAEGHKYRLNYLNVKGVEFLDLSHLTGSYKFIEGSRCILLFEMPKRKEPANLTFLYYFKEAWEDALSKKGQIDIKIQ